jgi:hypothetical protein
MCEAFETCLRGSLDDYHYTVFILTCPHWYLVFLRWDHRTFGEIEGLICKVVRCYCVVWSLY